MEENIKKYFCEFCKKNGDKYCMNIQKAQSEEFICYSCRNFQNNIQLESYTKYIKFDFYDDNGNKIVIIKPKTPLNVILELRNYYDYVKHRA